MTRYWPFWLGGLYLAMVPVLHWLLLHRMFAMSGRFTALTDWLRARLQRAPAPDADAPDAEATPLGEHLVFLVSVAVGGALAASVARGGPPRPHGLDGAFVSIFGQVPIVCLLVLVIGGALVGFGTRMAGGCTSGHGLCGVSRLQPGSLLSTACFFGAGIAVSFLLNAILGPA